MLKDTIRGIGVIAALLGCTFAMFVNSPVLQQVQGFAVPSATAATGPIYTVEFWAIEIKNTRSRHNDTDYASIEAKTALGKTGPITKFLGDLNNGVHPVHVQLANVPLANDSHQAITIAWQVLNNGHGSSDALQQGVGSALDAVAAGATAGVISAPIGAAAAALRAVGVPLFFADCDGVVVAGTTLLGGSDLYAKTSGPHRDFDIFLDSPGADSPHGCGSNSNYRSQVKIIRTSG